MNLKKALLTLFSLALIFITSVLPVHAQLPNILAPQSTGCNWGEVNTALGCISTDAQNGGFVGSLLTVAVGLGGGIALLLMLYGVFIITTSSGMPEKLKEGQEIITSAVTGLVFILISIFLMNFIGVKILAIPGL